MITNSFKIAWRHIRKNGFHSFITIFGLFIGILFTILIGAFIWSELRVNKTLRHANAQYLLTSLWKDPNQGNVITTVGPLSKRLKEAYPHLVAEYYRWDGITSVVSKGDKHFRENIQLGDSTLLSMFGFPLLHGDAKTALLQPYSVVVTQDLAVKYFGKADVVGQTLTIQSFSGSKHDFAITGVLKSLPENSITNLIGTDKNTLFIPVNTFTFFGRTSFDDWTNIYIPSYIELKEGVTAKDLELPIQQLIRQHAPDDIKSSLGIKPVSLPDFYLQNNNGLVKRMLYALSFVGLFLLLMAVINFINISISNASKRMKEIGIRKVMGGLKKQIVLQLLAESVLIVFIAAGAALIFYPIAKPLFEGVVGKNLPQLTSFPLSSSFILFGFIMLLGVSAGLYPAFVLSSLHTIDSLKGRLRTVKERTWLRKAMVGFQFCIAAMVMVGAFIVEQQVSYFFGKRLGYDKEFVVASQVPRDWSRAGVQKMETIRNAFASMPQVNAVTLSYEIPNGNNGGQPPVYNAGTDSLKAIAMQALVSDENYLKTYAIPLTAGSF
jgi:putative ABC transport system permease protein